MIRRTNSRLRTGVFATCLAAALAGSNASAHTIFPSQINFRVQGETSTVDVVDCCGCIATVGATSANTSIATVSPASGSGTAVQFVVTAQTDQPLATTLGITVVGNGGVGDFGQPCLENSLTTLSLSVNGKPDSSAQLKVSGKNGDPVNTLTGELFDTLPPDIVVPGSRPLHFQRYYASDLLSDQGGPSVLGNNWLHNYELKVVDDGTFVDVILEQGRLVHFSLVNPTGIGVGDYQLQFPTDIAYGLTKSGTFTFTDPERNRVYQFGSNGKLSSITDANGRQTTLTYVGANLTQVSDGQSSLTFAYSGSNLVSVTATDGRSVTFAYTGTNLTAFTDVRGGVTQYTYDATDLSKGLLSAVTLPAGNVPWTHGWDGNDKVGTQTDSGSNAATLGYAGNTTTLTDPLANTQTHIHDASNRLISIVDEANQSATFGYDASDRRTSVTDRLGSTISYTYHAASGQIASITNPDSGVTQLSYTARGDAYDLTGITYPDGTTESVTYDANGQPTSRTNRANDQWTTSYDANWQVLTQTTPQGGVTTLSWNANRTLNTLQDPSGNTTTMAYDSNRRPNLLTFADGATQAFVYDAAGNITQHTDERGFTTNLVYDGNGNLTSFTNPLNDTVTFTYDGQDRITTVTNPLGDSRSLSYDALGRLSTLTDEDGIIRSASYDARGRIVAYTKGSDTYTQTFDAEGTLATATDPIGNTTAFTSNNMGRITAVQSGRGFTTAYNYDTMGRLTAKTDPAGLASTLSYDALGAPSQLGHAGVTTGLTRNKLSQITGITDANGQAWAISRDNAGRITSESDPLGNTKTYTRDLRNRVSMVTYPAGLGSVTYTRDLAGLTTRALYSDGLDLNFTYDAIGRPTGGTQLSFTYDANGQLTASNGIGLTSTKAGRIETITMATGKTVTYAYDSRGLPTSVTDWAGNVTTLTYNAIGRVASIARPNGVTTTYTYDADRKVATVTDGALASISLTRDQAGRITGATRNLPGPAAVSPAANTLTVDTASQVTANSYDALGRRTADSTRNYTWDLASRLTGYSEGATAVTFDYDAFGMRIGRTVSGTTQEYVWNYAFNIPSISVTRQAATDQRYYVHLPNGQLLYSLDETDNSTAFYHYDERGNTVFLTNAAGTVTDAYRYSPFGAELASAGSSNNPFRYQGQYGVMREAADLHYVRARYYDSAAARFISRDPIRSRLPHRVNPYEFASGSPLQWIDPVGTQEGTMPDWANKSGAVGIGGNTTLGGTNGLNFRTYVSPTFGIAGTIGFDLISATIEPVAGASDSSVQTAAFSIGLYGSYKLAFWQRGSLSSVLGIDLTTTSQSMDAPPGTARPLQVRTTPLPDNLPVPLQQTLQEKRQRLVERLQRGDPRNAAGNQSATDILIGLGLQGEYFPTQYLSLFAQTGIGIEFLGDGDASSIGTDPDSADIGLSADLLGAFGFTVWFN